MLLSPETRVRFPAAAGVFLTEAENKSARVVSRFRRTSRIARWSKLIPGLQNFSCSKLGLTQASLLLRRVSISGVSRIFAVFGAPLILVFTSSAVRRLPMSSKDTARLCQVCVFYTPTSAEEEPCGSETARPPLQSTQRPSPSGGTDNNYFGCR